MIITEGQFFSTNETVGFSIWEYTTNESGNIEQVILFIPVSCRISTVEEIGSRISQITEISARVL